MQSHALLWIDNKGRLCASPPTSGTKIAAFAGDEIDKRVAVRYKLEIRNGEVVQKGKPAINPVSTPPAMVADRALYISSDGVLCDSVPAEGIKIADEGQVVASYYIVEHGLGFKDGKVAQKQKPKPDNKAVEASPNKARRGVHEDGD